MKKNLLIRLSLAALVLSAFSSANAQYFSLAKLYHPGNPGGVNTDPDFDVTTTAPPTGSTVLVNYPTAKGYTLQYTAAQTIPFTFDFNGGPVTQYKISTSGYITFSKLAVTPVGPANTTLPSVSLPDSTICVWGLAGAGLGGQVYTKVYGTAPHRQLWIGYWFAGNPSDTNSQNMWGIVLEETTNNIYVVDEWGVGNTTSALGIYNPINLTIGVQVNSTTAYQISGSPSINSQTSSYNNSDNDYYEFSPGTQLTYDASVVNTNFTNAKYYGVGGSYAISGNVANFGSTALKSFQLYWQVTGSTASATNVSSVNITSEPVVQYDSVTASWSWIPTVAGTYTLKLWATNLNGGFTDQNHSNDTLIVSNIKVIDTVVQKVVLFEEFMQASCNPCMYAAPNLDSVLANNVKNCIPIRYHVDWPGTDYMNNEIQTPFVSSRVGYYGVTGVPDARIDGSTDVSPSTVASADVQADLSQGSPFRISITSCTYNALSNMYNLSADVKSYSTMPATTLQAVLTIDSITYLADQSTEDPKSSFAPPIGTTTGGNPDSYYQYVTVFPQVAEDMLPSSSGTALAAFTPEQIQTVNLSWTKNHPWGSSPSTYKYDSSSGFRIVLFVQDNSTKYVYQATLAPNPTAVGLASISNNAGSMQVYPNPFNNETHVVYSLSQEQNVNIEVWNMIGQKVIDMSNGKQTVGQHEMIINKGNLQPGMYFIRLVTDQGIAVQKLEIE